MYTSAKPYFYGTGRRKKSVARVRIVPGTGVITINGKNIDEKIESPDNEPGFDCFYFKCRSFLEACRDGGKAPVPSSQIIINQAILDAIVKSAELGKEVEVVIPEI